MTTRKEDLKKYKAKFKANGKKMREERAESKKPKYNEKGELYVEGLGRVK